MIRCFAFTSLAAALAAAPAAAQDARTSADAIVAAIGIAGITGARYDSVTGDAANFTINGLNALYPDPDGGEPVPLRAVSVTVTNGAIAPTAVSADAIVLSGVSAGDADASLRVEAFAVTGLWVNPLAMETSGRYDFVQMRGLTIDADGQGMFAMDGMDFAARGWRGGEPMETDFIARGMRIEIDPADAPEEHRTTISMISGSRLDIDVASRWDPESGIAELSRYTMAASGLGRISMTASASGVSQDVVDLARAMRQNPDAVDDPAVMLRAGDVSLRGLEMRFQNDGLVERLVAETARTRGQDEATVTDGLVAMSAMFANSIPDPAFRDNAKGAIEEFLRSPRSLTFRLAPQRPLAIKAVIDTKDPATLLRSLAPSLAANR